MFTAHGVVDGLVLLRKRLRSGDVVDVITINTHLVRLEILEILQQLGIDLEPSLKHCLGCLGSIDFPDHDMMGDPMERIFWWGSMDFSMDVSSILLLMAEIRLTTWDGAKTL